MTDLPPPPTPRRPVVIDLGAGPRPDAGRRSVAAEQWTDVHHPTAGTVMVEAGLTPATAPPVPEGDEPAPPPAMARAAAMVSAAPSGLAATFFGLVLAFIAFAFSVSAFQWVERLIVEHPVLGWIGAALLGAVVLIAVAVALRELLALRRLARIDHLQRDAAEALARGDLSLARGVARGLAGLYAERPALDRARERVRAREADIFDADGLLRLAETELLAPLDLAARAEVEAAARQVATVTAVVPLPLADIAAALAANLRMIRRIATIYGGRSGTVGAWRLVRTVMTHLVATGAVAVGDDVIHGLAGGTVLARLSRRFGEGVVNGTLTARVGVAAIEVCRPLPFLARERPSVTALVGGALKGLFGQGSPAPSP